MYQVRHRVLRERVDGVLARAEERQDEECFRLTLLVLTLLDRHAVDGKGRCRACRTRAWRRRKGRCAVLALVGFYLEQPEPLITGAESLGSI